MLVRLDTLGFLEVELGTESFISWRCPRPVLSCVGTFIYTAGSLFRLGKRNWVQRQPLILRLISRFGFSFVQAPVVESGGGESFGLQGVRGFEVDVPVALKSFLTK